LYFRTYNAFVDDTGKPEGGPGYKVKTTDVAGLLPQSKKKNNGMYQ